MAVISKIRKNVGLVIGLIGVSMVAFILTDLFRNTSAIFSSGQNEVGNIAGTPIDYTAYNKEIENAIYQEQQRSKTNTVAEDIRMNMVNRAWDNLVNEVVMGKEFESSGVNVASGELMDMFIGPDPSPIVVQQFAQGGQPYDPNQMKQILARAKNEPEVRQYLSDLEKYMVSMRLQEKYMNLVRSGMLVSREEAKNAYLEENSLVSFQYLGINYSSIPDSSVQVKDEDIEKYISKHKEQFKIKEPEADVVYVPFYKIPSAIDTADALAYLEKIKPEFISAKNDSLFVSAKSAFPFDTTYKAFGQLDDFLKENLEGVKGDSVVGPLFDGNLFRLIKISNILQDTLPRIKVKHLLVGVRGGLPEDTLKSKARADSMFRVVTLANFEDKVAQASDDNGTVTNGGELGWYTPGRMGGEFDEKILTLPVNKPTLLKSSRGFHIVVVTEKTNTVYQIAEVIKPIVPSSNTLRELYRQADIFAGAVTESNQDFSLFARSKGIEPIALPTLKPSVNQLPNLLGTGELVKWGLTSESGKTSGVIETFQGFIVANVVSRKDEGYLSVEEARKNIDRKILNAVKARMIKEKLAATGSQDLAKVRDSYGNGAFLSQADNVSFASGTAPGIGNDPVVVGRAFSLEPQQVSSPVIGQTGVYLIKVTSKNQPAPPSEDQIRQFQQNLSQSKTNNMASKVFVGVRESANIKDFRFKFGF